MPHPESERRREFLRWTLSKNAGAHSRDALADMNRELMFLDEVYEMNSDLPKPDRDPEIFNISEPDSKSVEVKIDTGKFNS